jgi:hypothetical protein
MTPRPTEDLIVLAAELSMQVALVEMIERHQSLGMRKISFRVLQHPNYDSGVFQSGHKILQSESKRYQHALAICDRHGCGRDALPREEIEKLIEAQLANHWDDRAAAIVIDPELENWVWTESRHVGEAIGWPGGMSALWSWLRDRRYLLKGQAKPSDPKEALVQALRTTRQPRSSSLYKSLAAKVSLTGCTDPAFLKLQATLQAWFPPAPPQP